LYYFPQEGLRKQVCKNFFVKTLDVSDQMIRYNLKLKQANDNVVAVVGNTRTARNKTKSADEQDVENHIRAFPRSPFSPLRAVEESNFSFAVLGMLEVC